MENFLTTPDCSPPFSGPFFRVGCSRQTVVDWSRRQIA